MRTLRTRDGKLIDDLARNSRSWFDLEQDRQERAPRSDFDSGTGAELQARFQTRMSELEEEVRTRPGAPVSPDVPDDVMKSLQGFGYLGGDEEE